MPRMRILSASEQESFDKPPLFDYRVRKQFFSLPRTLIDIANTLGTPSGQIGFFVMSGYFKATKRFFLPYDFHARDIEACSKILGLHTADFASAAYGKTTRIRHQKRILEFYGFTPFDKKAQAVLTSEITTMVRTHLKPGLIFDRCVDFLIQKRIQIPTARTVTDMIRSGLHRRKAELVALMDANLTDETRCLLDELFTAPDDQNRYRLTLLKKLNQSTKPSRIKECAADFETLSALYAQLDEILTTLDLGPAGIRYYAGSVLKSAMFQIQRREANDRYIHAAAFVAYQFYRIQDHLTDMLLSVMASFQTTTTRAHKERLLEQRRDHQKQIKAVVNDLDTSVFGLIREIRQLAESGLLSDSQKVVKIRAVLDQGETGSFERLKTDLETAGQDQSWYEVLEDHSLRLQNRVNPILKALAFEPAGRAATLMAAIENFKVRDGSINDHAPNEFLDAEERAVLTRADGTFRPSLYKVFLFQHVAGAIKSGNLNLAQSYRHRPMDAYLIDPERWQCEKPNLLDRAGLTAFAEPGPVLKALNDALTAQYQATNANAEDNPYLKFRADGRFQIKTPALDTDETVPFQVLFPQRHDVPLAQVLETINNHSGTLAAFEHWQQTHTRQTVSRPTLLAGIMGLGCGIGVRKNGADFLPRHRK